MTTREIFLTELDKAVPRLSFGIREPRESIYAPPLTLWNRIKQVFTGPKFIERAGEVEIAIIGSGITCDERARCEVAIGCVRPIGVLVSYIEYTGGNIA
jgi:hypothetical protein